MNEFDVLFAEHQKLLGELQAMRAVAQPEQEPVAYAVYCGYTLARKHSVHFEHDTANKVASEIESFDKEVRPLYTSPPQRTWVGLTDDEIRHIYICTTGWSISDSDPMLVDFAENIESKLRSKNGY